MIENVKASPKVRIASHSDLPAIMAIFNREVCDTVNSFRTHPLDDREAERWWVAREKGRYPAWVAELEGIVVGWASLSRWSAYEGYAGTAEVSVWTDPSARRQGVGQALFTTLVAGATERNFRVLLSRIEASNLPSIELHRKFGFTEIGTMHNVGEKFGRLLDVLMMEKQLST